MTDKQPTLDDSVAMGVLLASIADAAGDAETIMRLVYAFAERARAEGYATAIATLRQRVMQWRPIETAPDSPEPMLLRDDVHRWISYRAFGEEGMEWRSNDEGAGDLTHWAPLLKLP